MILVMAMLVNVPLIIDPSTNVQGSENNLPPLAPPVTLIENQVEPDIHAMNAAIKHEESTFALNSSCF